MNYTEFLVEVAAHFVDVDKEDISNKIREKIQQSEMSRIQNKELLEFVHKLKGLGMKV